MFAYPADKICNHANRKLDNLQGQEYKGDVVEEPAPQSACHRVISESTFTSQQWFKISVALQGVQARVHIVHIAEDCEKACNASCCGYQPYLEAMGCSFACSVRCQSQTHPKTAAKTVWTTAAALRSAPVGLALYGAVVTESHTEVQGVGHTRQEELSSQGPCVPAVLP